jgi:hypothetical protein
MAKVHLKNDPLLVGIYSPRGGLIRGVRKSGRVVARLGGGHKIVGKVRPGATIEQLRAKYEANCAKQANGYTVRVHDDLGGAPVRIPVAQPADER